MKRPASVRYDRETMLMLIRTNQFDEVATRLNSCAHTMSKEDEAEVRAEYTQRFTDQARA